MPAALDLTTLAVALSVPSRAAMLDALMGGIALPASELAYRAGVSNPTASSHLAKLLEAGLVRVNAQGRHRYYELAGEPVARAMETLSTLTAEPRRRPPPRGCSAAMRRARFCYDHLAGELGVALHDALLRTGSLVHNGDDPVLTEAGARRLAAFGVDLSAATSARRRFARPCLDWSERRSHLAGALGAALAGRMLDLGWIRRSRDDRTVEVTAAGLAGLRVEFGIHLAERA